MTKMKNGKKKIWKIENWNVKQFGINQIQAGDNMTINQYFIKKRGDGNRGEDQTLRPSGEPSKAVNGSKTRLNPRLVGKWMARK